MPGHDMNSASRCATKHSHSFVRCQRQSEDQVFQTYETAAEAARREELFADETLKEAQQWKGQIQVPRVRGRVEEHGVDLVMS